MVTKEESDEVIKKNILEVVPDLDPVESTRTESVGLARRIPAISSKPILRS